MRPPIHRPSRTVLAWLIALALIDLPGCAVTWLLNNSWLEVQSEHFTITTDMTLEDAEELARDLELFRAAVLVMSNAGSLESSVPTRVFFFARESSFRSFRSASDVLGYLRATLRANFVAIVDQRSIDVARVLRHEYVHFLVRNRSRRVYPMWYDEGFAELLSTASQVGEHVAIGMIPEDRIRELKRAPWAPIRHVLAYGGAQASSLEPVAIFYAQSWALLHYLSRDMEHAARLGPSVEVYLDQIESGADIDTACQAAFGISVDELDEQVRLHLRGGSFTPLGVRTDRLQWPEQTTSRPLSRAEVAERLGELSMAGGNTENSEAFFRAALAADPTLARAHAGMGDVLKTTELWADAERHFAMAADLGPDDPLNPLDYGEYWLTRARQEDDPDARRVQLERARELVLRARDLDERKPEPWAVYGATFLLEGEDPSRGIESLEQALQLLPSSTDVQLMLAETYVGVGRKPEARALLGRILSWSHEGESAQKARELAARLDPSPEASTEVGP